MRAIFEIDKRGSFDKFHLTSCTKQEECALELSNKIFI